MRHPLSVDLASGSPQLASRQKCSRTCDKMHRSAHRRSPDASFTFSGATLVQVAIKPVKDTSPQGQQSEASSSGGPRREEHHGQDRQLLDDTRKRCKFYICRPAAPPWLLTLSQRRSRLQARECNHASREEPDGTSRELAFLYHGSRPREHHAILDRECELARFRAFSPVAKSLTAPWT